MALRRSRFQFGLSTLLLAAVVAALVMGFLTRGPVASWVGHFELTMQLASESGREIKEVSYAAFFRRDLAEWVATHPVAERGAAFDQATTRNGRFVASVMCSGKRNLLGYDISYFEPRYLVLRVTYADGTLIRRAVEVPAGRGPRSIVVPVP